MIKLDSRVKRVYNVVTMINGGGHLSETVRDSAAADIWYKAIRFIGYRALDSIVDINHDNILNSTKRTINND